ncbi:hypothetical protein ACWDUH_04970 [Micromonospora wenchangensis]
MNAKVRAAATAGVGVLLTGFGALNAFEAAAQPVHGLPGLYDFASATWGDGIALPVMTAALVYALAVLPPGRYDRAAAGLGAVVGAALGAATQVLWLRDDTPALNWTLPTPHRFTGAGWYHAVFLTVMCALTATLWSLLLARLATTGTECRRAAGGPVMVAVVAGAAFIALLAVDSHGTTTSAHATRYAAAAGTALLIVGTLIATIRSRKADVAKGGRRRPG